MREKHQRRRRITQPKLRRCSKHLIGLGVATALALPVLFLAQRILFSSSAHQSAILSRKMAAIVDQVALTEPNPEFIDKALSYLIPAGFDVDIYEAEDITVEFYRTLPTKGYDLIIIRTHASSLFDEEGKLEAEEVSLFTSQPYSRIKYIPEQLREELAASTISYETANQDIYYFSIGPKFVRNQMEGRFDDTLIIIGGCQSMAIPDMAESLVDRGASMVIGWDEWVDLDHNDRALDRLLNALLVQGKTVDQAVATTMAEVGPDPFSDSVLTYFPFSASGSATCNVQSGKWKTDSNGSFTISDCQILDYKQVLFQGDKMLFMGFDAIPIEGNQFSVQQSLGTGTAFITGRFTSPTRVRGSLSIPGGTEWKGATIDKNIVINWRASPMPKGGSSAKRP